MVQPAPAYAELQCLSNFTFLRGASHPEELVHRAQHLGYRALALTDECSFAGIVRAHTAAKAQGLPLLPGTEIQLDDGPRLVLLACNRIGYGDLSALITLGRGRAGKGCYQLLRQDIDAVTTHCLALLIPPSTPWSAYDLVKEHALWLRVLFAHHAWLGVSMLRDGQDVRRLHTLRSLSTATALPLVATGDVHMHDPERQPLQDTLTAVRLGSTVAAAVPHLFPNAERHLRCRNDLALLYPAELLAETVVIAGHCHFTLDELRYEYPEEIVPAGTTPTGHLRCLTETGMHARWPQGVPDKVRKQVEHELQLIAELRYEPYFLTVYDVVRFAKSQGILCQGRGSAANSAVCYCLGITDVDPARMELLFERFISKERHEPPDIDVDFEHQRREEVLQYIYAKYGRARAALAATVVTYRPKSAIRDVGKALGFSLDQVDRLAKDHYWWDGGKIDSRALSAAGFASDLPQVHRLAELVNSLVGFPRHLSQHVGGMVIARERLDRLVPIENAAMPGRTVIQWDKTDLDDLGLLKVDCLCLGMLSALRRAFALIREYKGQDLTLATLPPDDPATYAMIQKADTMGVFQIESRAQMAMLPRLKPRNYYDLVIEVAIVRPGPIQGDMVHPYLRRREAGGKVRYPSPEVEQVLRRTLGVPIFQEQVIKLAMVAAGFTPGEADQLRRSMAAWHRRGGLAPFEEKLINGMLARGYSSDFARRIFKQIQGFGEYGFPESHAASFALLVYASAWIKCHEPAAFTCALLNSQPMGFYAPAQLIQDVRRHDVIVLPVDVRISVWDCTFETNTGQQPHLRLGLRMVKGLAATTAERIVTARAEQPFYHIQDLAERALINRRELSQLAAADALRGLVGDRRQAQWQVLGVEPGKPLFAGQAIAEQPALLQTPTQGEAILTDYASTGLSLRGHPLALLRGRLRQQRFLSAEEIRQCRHGERVRTAGIVINRQRPGTASGVVFVTLEDETGHINLIVWNHLVLRQRRELLGARLLGVYGEVQRESEVIHVVARRLEDHSALLGGLHTHSRDFH